MPQIVCCGNRRWGVSADDFACPAIFFMSIRILSLAGLIPLAVVSIRSNQECAPEISYFLYASLAINFVGILADLYLWYHSTRGYLIQVEKRRKVPQAAQLQSSLVLFQAISAAYGIYAVFGAPDASCTQILDYPVHDRLLQAFAILNAVVACIFGLMAGLLCCTRGDAAWMVSAEEWHSNLYAQAHQQNTSRRHVRRGSYSTSYVAPNVAGAFEARREETWNRRCQRYARCCRCSSAMSTTDSEQTFQALGRVMASVLRSVEALHLTISDVASALALLRVVQKAREIRLNTQLVALQKKEGDINDLHSRIPSCPETELVPLVAVFGFMPHKRALNHSPLHNVSTIGHSKSDTSDRTPSARTNPLGLPRKTTAQLIHRFHFQMLESALPIDVAATRGLTEGRAALLRARHFSRFALAPYGWMLYTFDHLPTACCRLTSKSCYNRCCEPRLETSQESNPLSRDKFCTSHPNVYGDWTGCNTAALRLQVRDTWRQDILYASWESQFYRPAVTVFFDRTSDSLVIALRGTLSLEDCITDAMAVPQSAAEVPELDDFAQLVAETMYTSKPCPKNRVSSPSRRKRDRQSSSKSHTGSFQTIDESSSASMGTINPPVSPGIRQGLSRAMSGRAKISVATAESLSPHNVHPKHLNDFDKTNKDAYKLYPVQDLAMWNTICSRTMNSSFSMSNCTESSSDDSSSTNTQIPRPKQFLRRLQRRADAFDAPFYDAASDSEQWFFHEGMMRAARYVLNELIRVGIFQRKSHRNVSRSRSESEETSPGESNHLLGKNRNHLILGPAVPPEVVSAISGIASADSPGLNSVSGPRIVVVGHSLGAGVTTLLTPLLAPSFPRLHGYAYAAPGAIVSPSLSIALRPFVTSIIIGKDMVPRMSMPALRRLFYEMLSVYGAARLSKPRLIRDATLNLCARIFCRLGTRSVENRRHQEMLRLIGRWKPLQATNSILQEPVVVYTESTSGTSSGSVGSEIQSDMSTNDDSKSSDTLLNETIDIPGISEWRSRRNGSNRTANAPNARPLMNYPPESQDPDYIALEMGHESDMIHQAYGTSMSGRQFSLHLRAVLHAERHRLLNSRERQLQGKRLSRRRSDEYSRSLRSITNNETNMVRHSTAVVPTHESFHTNSDNPNNLGNQNQMHRSASTADPRVVRLASYQTASAELSPATNMTASNVGDRETHTQPPPPPSGHSPARGAQPNTNRQPPARAQPSTNRQSPANAQPQQPNNIDGYLDPVDRDGWQPEAADRIMWMGGRVLHLAKIRTWKRNPYTIAKRFHETSTSPSVCTTCFRSYREYAVAWTHPADFDHIEVSNLGLADHMPDRMDNVLSEIGIMADHDTSLSSSSSARQT